MKLFARIIFQSLLFINACFAQSSQMRSLKELINTTDPAWTMVSQWTKEAKNKTEILPRDKVRAENALVEAQVTTRSPMGAVIYETGGILIDDGWLRILGSGSKKLDRELMRWNKGKSYKNLGERLPFLLIADDVLGGFFAVNAGGIDSVDPGKVFYLAPDNLHWDDLGLSYSEFLNFCLSGDIHKFYESFYWNGWESDVKKVSGDEGFSCFPFLWTAEAKDVEKVSRKAVPIEELWKLETDFIIQMSDGKK